ncbi:MAG: MerR family transcriptional regulator [Actinobacteria bacterium]|nr:MerR family transcriptional regulator [Actinomycetota bacterium]MBO0834617.1 MerR family transcriptional regulator [Actinomycetota bacterium]
MAKLTLAIDEQVLRRARIRAMEQGTTVNALVREYIARLAGESKAAEGVAEFLRIVSGAGAGSGSRGRSWSGEGLHDRARDQ